MTSTNELQKNTLVDPKPKNFHAMLSKDISTVANPNISSENSKDTLKVPDVVDIFPEKLQEQNYSRRKKAPIPTKERSASPGKTSPVRKLSTCLEPHEPVIDSLPAPVPLSPSPRPTLTRNISINSNSSFDTFSKQSGILGES